MMTKLISIANKNIILYNLIKVLVFISMHAISAWYEISGWFRCTFLVNSHYSYIKNFENAYAGKRCFIICTGPSLTLKDIEKLKNEYTFGMNSLCLLKDKSDFRPDFYSIIDSGVLKKLKNEIIDYCSDTTQIFVSDRINRIEKTPDSWKVIPLNVAYHTYDRWFKNKFWCKFSDNAYAGLYDMYSVTHFIIQIAVYMGFKEIYLIGCDCNQTKGKAIHFQDYGVPDTSIDTARERNINGFEEVKHYCDQHDVTVYNATRGGMLEVFERVNFDNLFQEDN